MTNNKNIDVYKFNTAIQAILDGEPYLEVRKSMLTSFRGKIDSLDGPALILFYKMLKNNQGDVYAFGDEATLNEIGYYLLSKNRVADAIVVFKYNTALFPDSWNVYDSLGEAYYRQGDKQHAMMDYSKSLQINPGNQNAKDILDKLAQ